ncbi:MFS transporter [Nonomuraea sp. NPDC050202]|uniref:MFS transporter n=1 Tax=Nonomuraea sp. NPDC050202 TaxID=3155035 RepID=UPI003408DE0D
MITPSPLRPRRLPLFGLAVALVAVALTFSTPSLLDLTPVTPGVYQLRGLAATVAALLVAPLLGVLVDRARRRRTVLVALALVGAAGLAITRGAAAGWDAAGAPAAATGMIMVGCLTALGPVGQEAYLPAIVGRDRLVSANALLYVLPQGVMVAIGVLLAWAEPEGPALVIVVCALLVLAAAAFRGVEAVEPVQGAQTAQTVEAVEAVEAVEEPSRAGLWREAMEGVRFTLREPALRAIALCLMVTTLSAEFTDEVEDAARDALVHGVPASGYFSLSLTVIGYGSIILGPPAAVLLHRRLGTYRLAWVALLASQPFTLLLALSGGAGGFIWYTAGKLVPLAGAIVVTIALTSHRQAITPDRLLGRVSGTLVALVALSETAGTILLGPPGDWLAELAEDATSPLPLLPGLVLATALAMAAAVPLLRARRLATAASREEARSAHP